MPKPNSGLMKRGNREVDIWLIAGCSMVQSLGGLVIPELYRDGTWVLATWRGNDLVTLTVAGPLLIGTMSGVRRGFSRAHLVRVGMLFYMFYNYSFYVFGAAVNRFFLFYVSIFVMVAYALVLALIFTIRPAEAPGNQRTNQWVSGYMMLMALIVASLWIVQWVVFLMTGTPPQLAGDESAYRLVAALDLSIQVPALALGSILLWRRNTWGYLIAVILTTGDAVYMLVLLAFAPFAARAGIENPWQQAPLWFFLGAGCLASSIMLLRNRVHTIQEVHALSAR